MLKLESLQFFIPTARGRNFGMEKNVINAPSGGVFPIYYNITWGGSGQFITILHGGGSGQFITILHGEGGVWRDPQIVLRNI